VSEKKVTLRVEGAFPAGAPDTIKVEPELGTFELKRGDTTLASGQLAKA
jgi:hypothetical protein